MAASKCHQGATAQSHLWPICRTKEVMWLIQVPSPRDSRKRGPITSQHRARAAPLPLLPESWGLKSHFSYGPHLLS